VLRPIAIALLYFLLDFLLQLGQFFLYAHAWHPLSFCFHKRARGLRPAQSTGLPENPVAPKNLGRQDFRAPKSSFTGGRAGSAPRSKFQDPRAFLSGLSPMGARAPSRALPRFGASRDSVSAAPIISDTQRRHKRHRSLGDSQVGERVPPRSRLRPSRVSGAKKSRPQKNLPLGPP